MGKVVLIIVLAIVVFVLVSAVCGKNPVDLLVVAKYIIKDFIERIVNKKNYKILHHGLSDVTIERPVLEINQIKRNSFGKMKESICENFEKYIFAQHLVYSRAFNDENDEPIGVTISRPDADTDGIRLYADVIKGQYDTRNQTTHDAFSVNKDAVIIGWDEEGFYGEVCNKHAKVYVRNENNEMIKIPYKGQFAIAEDTFVCIGYQWLCFKACAAPRFDDDFGVFDDTADNGPIGFDLGSLKRKIGAVVNNGVADDSNDNKNNKDVVIKPRENKAKVNINARRSGNPLEEDDF